MEPAKPKERAMNHETEMELVDEQFEGNPEPELPRAWVSEITQILAEHRERKEAIAAAPDFHPTLLAPMSPARVAAEMRSRARFLRSKRGPRRTKKLELAILEELDAAEAQARAVEEEQQGRSLGADHELRLAVFTVRLRFADLMERQDLPFTVRARAQDPDQRRWELEQIEAFLARKRSSRAA
jgi:hypothetical protein